MPRPTYDELSAALRAASEVLDDYADVHDGEGESGPRPNRAMSAAADIDALLRRLDSEGTPAPARCVICGREMPYPRVHVDTCGERCFKALLTRQRARIRP